ncbi:hypothetical protein HPB51_026651 [Rhipicephalus microplus]|uniref:Uncharacterized protein n=1 Tax=Rhipicephalus microplus TaxID=6941 RepID=A0A9J6D2H2_RHIMP|nr:hypothetical protein HPB51_026651 [Rhipicephalus microplus]
MRRAVALHCDVSGRPYRIDDFRKPLKDLGVIQQVSGIGAYQMSHVWLLNMKTVEAKKALTDAGVLKVKDRACLVIDPTRQEVKMKLHWLAFDVTKDAIRRAFYEYGDVKRCVLAAVQRWSWCREDRLCACGAEVRGICDAIVRSQSAANATLSVMSRTSVTVHTHELQGEVQRLNRVRFSWMRRNLNKRLACDTTEADDIGRHAGAEEKQASFFSPGHERRTENGKSSGPND